MTGAAARRGEAMVCPTRDARVAFAAAGTTTAVARVLKAAAAATGSACPVARQRADCTQSIAVWPTAVVAIVATAPEIGCYDAEIDPGMVDYVHKIARVAPAASRSTPCYAPPIQGVSNTV